MVTGGWLRTGDEVTVLPSGLTSTIRALYRWGDEVHEAGPGHAVVVQLDTNVDVARGDVLVAGTATFEGGPGAYAANMRRLRGDG